MHITDLKEAVRHFTSLTQPHRLCVIESADDFFREECIDSYKQKWLQDSSFSFLSVDVKGLESRAEELRTANLLFGDKFLFVVDITPLKAKAVAQFLSIIKDSCDHNFFLCTSTEAVSKKVVEQANCAIQIPALKPWDKQSFLVSWVIDRCKQEKKSIDKDAATLLVEHAAQDRSLLKLELEKVLLYKLESQKILRADVEKIYLPLAHSTMWQCLDALVSRDSSKLAASLHASDDWNAIALLRFLKNQLEKLLIAVEEDATPRNRSHERQLDTLRQLGSSTVCSWIRSLHMYELAIRSGVEEQDISALLPFFLSLISRS
jgi:DNA polymerase III delta subunit